MKNYEPKKESELLRNIISSIFQSALLIYLIALLGETLWKNSISSKINLNYILIIVIILGVVSVLYAPKEHKKEKSILDNPKIALITSVLSGIAGFAIIYYKLKTYSFGLMISIIAGILIILLSLLMLEEEDSETPKQE